MDNYISKLNKILNVDFINEFLLLVNLRCKNKRKPKYSNEYYLYYIILVLTDLQKWKSLKLFYTKEKENHYKTIQDKHLLWSNLNIYEDTYKILLNKYKKINLKRSLNLVLFIDSSDIYNKNGCEKIGYGNDPKKKKTRISAICDINKTIYSLIITNTNTKTNVFNNKKQIKKTLKHDSQTIGDSIDGLLIDVSKCRQLKLVGDKGYIKKKTDIINLIKTKNTQIIYPHRKNQKEKTSKSSKILLKDRYVIENVFAKLKSFDRICMRKDKLTVTFKGFMFLAIILMFKK
jgi:hypothetical protein